MNGYTFYVTTESGQYREYRNLRKGQALHRYHRARKFMLYAGMKLKSCGWSGPERV